MFRVASVLVAVSFQSTLPRGSDFACKLYISTSDISIHAPSRERLFCLQSIYINIGHFNPRSLAGATIGRAEGRSTINNFNPRSLAGATVGRQSGHKVIKQISIHAPSRERPSAWLSCRKLCQISIHAPSRERLKPYGQSLSRRGISIHAPSRERLSEPDLSYVPVHFNPRSLAGATVKVSPGKTSSTFQSTLPRGSDTVLKP